MKLDVGSGPYPKENFIHMDIELARPHLELVGSAPYLPFKNDSLEYVRASHIIEHLTVDDGYRFVIEAYRVLIMGGIIEIAGPNIEVFMSQWKVLVPPGKLHPDMQKIILGERTDDGQTHKSLHDEYTIIYLLKHAGFGGFSIDKQSRGPRDIIIYAVKEKKNVIREES